MICKVCNHRLPDDSEFCQYCGSNLTTKKPNVRKERLNSKKENNDVYKKMIDFTKKAKSKAKNISAKIASRLKTSPKTAKIFLLSVTTAVVFLFTTAVGVNYFTAPKKAENAVAIYLSKETSDYSVNYKFTSFKKTYSAVKFSKLKYVVELSGSANMGPGNLTTTFYAKVKVNSLTGDITISKVTYNGEKLKK